jgi:hypothetical protein
MIDDGKRLVGLNVFEEISNRIRVELTGIPWPDVAEASLQLSDEVCEDYFGATWSEISAGAQVVSVITGLNVFEAMLVVFTALSRGMLQVLEKISGVPETFVREFEDRAAAGSVEFCRQFGDRGLLEEVASGK